MGAQSLYYYARTEYVMLLIASIAFFVNPSKYWKLAKDHPYIIEKCK